MNDTIPPLPRTDPADALESPRELTADRTHAAQDFSSEDAGYHKTLRPR